MRAARAAAGHDCAIDGQTGIAQHFDVPSMFEADAFEERAEHVAFAVPTGETVEATAKLGTEA
mgnify:CR=1 FL=1